MNKLPWLSDAAILAARPPKNAVDPQRPYAFLVEPERTAAGNVEDVATLFLTNAECPFRCLMCDLWKNTTAAPVAPGAIPRQIDYALSRLPSAQHIKLYNSGNFFDAQAIPREDWPAIAERVQPFKSVIVENHPRLVTFRCLTFRDLLGGNLEMAMGLETIHPDIVPRLNKRMSLDDFARAVDFLIGNRIAVRAFILIKPPFASEVEGVEWALRSVEYAFSLGVGTCSLIPTRAGNGLMESLQAQGLFAPPSLASVEQVFAEGIAMGRGRVFLDLWDIERSMPCQRCAASRRERLHHMNLSQQVLPPIECDCQGEGR
jgi:radical SAM enzyme (TIGR01210 family)